MNGVFVDTGGWMACADRSDPAHAACTPFTPAGMGTCSGGAVPTATTTCPNAGGGCGVNLYDPVAKTNTGPTMLADANGAGEVCRHNNQAYPDGTVATDVEVHPTPIYETLAMGLVALVLWHLRDRVRPGVLFALWLVLAGLERFLIEFIRRNDPVAVGLTLAQLVSLAMVAAGAAWLLRSRRPGAVATA